MAEETLEERLARYEFVIDAYVRELTALREENARLKEGANALVTLQNIYRNSELPESIRTKAAQAAIQHEVPRLTPQPPAIDATCEVIEPLADVVRRQRARADRMMLEAPGCGNFGNVGRISRLQFANSNNCKRVARQNRRPGAHLRKRVPLFADPGNGRPPFFAERKTKESLVCGR